MKNEKIGLVSNGLVDAINVTETQFQPTHPVRTALLMISSALLGGVAFAIWNRRQMSAMRESRLPRTPISDEDDAIY